MAKKRARGRAKNKPEMRQSTHGKFTVGGFYYICAFAPYESGPRIGIDTVVFEGLKGTARKYYTFSHFKFPKRSPKADGFEIESLQQAERSVLTRAELVQRIADLEQQIVDMPDSWPDLQKLPKQGT